LVLDEDEIYGLSPVIFESTKNRPNNAIYRITDINGDSIVLDNSKNHIRNETNRPMYIGNHAGKASGAYGIINMPDDSSLTIPGLAIIDSLSLQELNLGDIIEVKNFHPLQNIGYYIVSGVVDGDGSQKFAIPVSGINNLSGVTFPESSTIGEIQNITYCKVSSGNCYIPQNNIYWNTSIGYENIYNRWGQNIRGEKIHDPVLIKYTIDDLATRQQKLNILIADEFINLLRETYSIKTAHDVHAQEHINDSRVLDVQGTGNVVDGTVNVFEGGGTLNNTQVVLDNAKTYINFSGIISQPDYETPANYWGSTYLSEYLESSGQAALRDKILQCFPRTFCISISGYNNFYNPSEYDSLFISFDRPNHDLNAVYTISAIEPNKIFINIRQDQVSNLLSRINNGSINLPYEGFAEIIPYHSTNNLINKNPNQNNTLYRPAITWLQESGTFYASTLSHITGEHTQYFDDRTKKQFHALEIQLNPEIDEYGMKVSGSIPSLENPYLIKMSRHIGESDNGSDKAFNFIINSIKPIEISNIAWKYNNITDGWTYTTGINNYVNIDNNILELFTNIDWSLRIRTDQGTYISGYKPAAPRVNIFGIKNYNVSNLQFTYLDNTYNNGY
jgi:hypothetical protein